MTELNREAKSLPTDESIRVVVCKQGPYLIYGDVPMMRQYIMPDSMGESWFYQRGESIARDGDPTTLCRCGASKSKPHCDGSHVSAEWSGDLTAPIDKILDDAIFYEGDAMLLSDNERYCCYARFCHPGGSVWHLAQESADPESRDLAIREASMCPSARLMAWDVRQDSPFEFDFERSIDILEDPAIDSSAGVWLRGGIVVEREEDGARYEVRNRVVLCRCGGSGNKPYCDGHHAAINWHDESAQGVEAVRGEVFPEGELEIEGVLSEV